MGQSLNRNPLRIRGFTLVEIAVVLVIIGLLLSGILNSRSVIRQAQTKDVIKAVTDMATASQQFRDRYGNWPGDLANADTHIPDLSAGCRSTGAGNGNNNGLIDIGESVCASEELIRASMLRGDADTPNVIVGRVTLSLTSGASAAGLATFPASWNNVVRVQNIDCDVAIQLDRALDDGNPATGNFRAGTVCPGQDENTAVADAVLRLN